ncbi:MAG TPA: hypothetical protein VF916_01570 [Ktedonobacterales bacterium]
MSSPLGAPTWALMQAAACPPVPALSYAPSVVGWAPLLLALINVLAGVACVGVVGSRLSWSADDRAPLRPLWIGLIALGFVASAAGLYIAFANQVHDRAVKLWLERASSSCLAVATSGSNLTNLNASTVRLSVQVGIVALVLIAAGVGGAIFERRRVKPPPR